MSLISEFGKTRWLFALKVFCILAGFAGETELDIAQTTFFKGLKKLPGESHAAQLSSLHILFYNLKKWPKIRRL